MPTDSVTFSLRCARPFSFGTRLILEVARQRGYPPAWIKDSSNQSSAYTKLSLLGGSACTLGFFWKLKLKVLRRHVSALVVINFRKGLDCRAGAPSVILERVKGTPYPVLRSICSSVTCHCNPQCPVCKRSPWLTRWNLPSISKNINSRYVQ